MREHEWLGVDEQQWFQTRYAIRLPDGKLAFSDVTNSPWMWDTRDQAERAIGYFKHNAAKIGVAEWHGEIVRQFCTPWVGETDSAKNLIAELSAWLEQQIGGTQ